MNWEDTAQPVTPRKQGVARTGDRNKRENLEKRVFPEAEVGVWKESGHPRRGGQSSGPQTGVVPGTSCLGQRRKESLLRKTGKRFRRNEPEQAPGKAWEKSHAKDRPGASWAKRGASRQLVLPHHLLPCGASR